FLASTSVFPTSAEANPTFFATVLAVRLAHHLFESSASTQSNPRQSPHLTPSPPRSSPTSTRLFTRTPPTMTPSLWQGCKCPRELILAAVSTVRGTVLRQWR